MRNSRISGRKAIDFCRDSFVFSRSIAVLLAGTSYLVPMGLWAFAQSGAISYNYRGADGTCCSGGIHPDNGHDGSWGLQDFVHTDTSLNIVSSTANQAGIMINVSGGNGGNGKDVWDQDHWGGNGGGGRIIDYSIANSTITSTGRGIDLYSAGGNGGLYGNAGGPNGGYGIGGDGHLVRATLTDVVIVSTGFGVAAQSWGGSGSDSAYVDGFGGERDAGSGGNAGAATVNLAGTTKITVLKHGPDDVSAGVGLISIGGNGGTANHTGDFGGHSNAGRGGDASDVTFTSSSGSSIITYGDGVYGVLARSIGGNASTQNGTDTHAERGGNAGTVTIDNAGTIVTTSNNSIGIYTLSQGGQGGNGGDGSWGHGNKGAPGGIPGAINITNSGTVTTGSAGTIGAKGIVAYVLGGKGGAGGEGGAFGDGGHGGAGGVAGQAITITNSGTITTAGNDAGAVIATAAGGGGGTASASSGIIAVGGGDGGAGGNGGNIQMTNGGDISTSGDNSIAVALQSIGGGGGHGGDANSTGVIASIAVGGKGGAAGNGEQVSFSSSGKIRTSGGNSSAVTLQSIGGGGGNAGSANAVGVGVGLNVTVATGGSGGSGGSGGNVSFTQSETGSIITLGELSNGVLAQSVGGGGGNGGLANSDVITIAPVLGDAPSGTIAVAVTHGGTGGAAGNGGAVDVTNAGSIATAAAQSNGVLAQSIGGGGGNGGGVIAPIKMPTIGSSNVNLHFSVRHGGNGGHGGDGGNIQINNSSSGTISTAGTGSIGILAQSIGGGGGNGGLVQEQDADSFTEILGSPTALSGLLGKVMDWLEKGPEVEFSKTVNLSVGVTNGGSGNTGGSSGLFNVKNDGSVVTTGDHAPGIVAQSVGGGGGNAGLIDSTGASSLLSAIDSLIAASESGTAEILSFSIPTFNITHQTGGSGGAGGNGGGTAATPSLVTNTGTIATKGDGSAGIVAQSIGGGGGRSTASGQSLEDVVEAAAGEKSAEIIETITRIIEVITSKGSSEIGSVIHIKNGGEDGAGGTGGAVSVDASASTSHISTQGRQAAGIIAQSVGGGGGVSAVDQPLFLWSNTASTVTMGSSSSLETAFLTSNGSDTNVVNGGLIATSGGDSAGIIAQSIGGGGGLSMVSLSKASLASIKQTTALSINMGGQFTHESNPEIANTQIHGGTVTVSNKAGAHITTQGVFSPGVVAQSIGDGGGMAALTSEVAISGIDIVLGSSSTVNSGVSGYTPSDNGGTVSVSDLGGLISTTGTLSFGVLAQSIGGGGGYVTIDDGANPVTSAMNVTFGAHYPMSGSGGAVNVTQNVGGTISTSGINAHGIVAQSIGGGGGIAGLTTSPDLVTLKSVSMSASGNGNNVAISVGGRVETTGAGATGILAQSIGGGGGLAGDQSSAKYTTDIIQNAGLTGGTGNGGAINVSIGADGTVHTTGASAPAILAMSVGGGGVFKDGTLYQYSTPNNQLAYGGDITINLGSSAQVVAEGADTPAVVAISNGTDGGGKTITFNLEQNALISANGTSGTAVLAMTPLGKTTINNSGTIQAGTAINASSQTTVNNNGIVAGDVLLGDGSTFNNNTGGSIYSGATFKGLLENMGILNPGGPGVYRTTRIEGVLHNSGTYRPDLDFGGHNSDFISVSGASTFTGTVRPVLRNPLKNVWLGIAHFDAMQTDTPTTASSSPLFSYLLKNNSSEGLRDPLISVEADFTPAAFSINADRTNIATHLQALWGQADPTSATFFDKFTGVTTSDEYKNALNGVANDGLSAHAANQMHASFTAMNRLMSCPTFVGEGTILREGDCTWARVDTNWTRREATVDDEAHRTRQRTITIGAQREIQDDWFLGASLSYGFGKISSSSSMSGDSDTFAGGLALKYNNAPWQISAAIHGGFERIDLERATLGGVAISKPETLFVSARLRAAYEISMPSWYIRPYVDLDVSHVHQRGYQEHGSELFNLEVFANGTTSVMASPMVEIGGRTNLSNGSTLRSYVAGGVSFLGGGDVVSTMKLSDFNVAPFSLKTGMPKTYGNLSLGMEYVTAKGVELKLEYGLRANDEYRDQSFSIRGAYRF